MSRRLFGVAFITCVSLNAQGIPLRGPAPAAPAGQAEKPPLDDYNDSVRKGDALYEAGNFFEAVLAYERAGRLTYNNKLKTDAQALQPWGSPHRSSS